jgi:hypothetical protein
MIPRPLNPNPFLLSPVTPGPLGHNDFGSPFAPPNLFGTTPGVVGTNDHAAHVATPKSKKKTAKHPKKKDPVLAAFERCRDLKWIPFFEDAAKGQWFTTELLMAIGYRESGLNPKYLEVAGDNGHGYGLMQADIRSFPKWVNAGNWKNAQACIAKGAEVLNSKYKEISDVIGKKQIKVTTMAGKVNHFDGKAIAGDDLVRVAVAAYNCGMWAYYHYSKGDDIDQGTTGQDYSADVLAKAARFKELLTAQPAYMRPGWLDLPSFANYA